MLTGMAVLVGASAGATSALRDHRPTSPSSSTAAMPTVRLPDLPLGFEPSGSRRGSSFVARSGGATVRLTGREITVVAGERRVLRMRLAGARADARLRASDRLPGIVNEFHGSDPRLWRKGIPTFGRVTARGVYRGIDVAYHGRQGVLEYDFVVAPGADPSEIALGFPDARSVRVDGSGGLLVRLADVVARQPKPRVYQDVAGRRRAVDGRFAVRADGLVTFALGAYDHRRAVVIDPTVAYSTYLGGGGEDLAFDVVVDASHSAYLVGYSSSTDFPTANALQSMHAGGTYDVWVAKLNPAGNALVYATYLGGSADDFGRGIAVDSTGHAYVVGWTASTNFPTANALQSTNAGVTDVFVTKLDATGGALVYSTYLGGSANDYASGIAVDGSGGAYVVGHSHSSNFPVVNAIQPSHAAGGFSDLIVGKLNAAGSALEYSTYLGGTQDEDEGAIAVDAGGNAYLTGRTFSTDFPTANALQAANAGGLDVLVIKLNPAGSALVYSTYLGGSGSDYGRGIAVDTGGSAYVTGETTSTNFPTANPFQATRSGSGAFTTDAYATKLSPAGGALSFSTYLGGSTNDYGEGVGVDANGNAYLAGYTSSANFPTHNALQATYAGGGFDVYVTKLSVAGSGLSYSTFLGGTGTDYAYSLAVEAAGDVYLTGYTNSTNFPTVNPIQENHAGGTYDAIVVKLAPTLTAVAVGSFRAERTRAGLILRWRSSLEPSLLGFDVYGGTGLVRRRLNEAVIAASARPGRWYAFRVPFARAKRGARYWLVERHLDGTRAWHGPVAPR